MLTERRTGFTAVIHNDERAIDIDVVRRNLITELACNGMQIKDIAALFGIHRQTASKLIDRDFTTTCLFGSGEWTPDVQDQSPATCNRCGGANGVIQEGSSLYCAACHRTGHERTLKQRRIRRKIQDTYEAIETDYEKAMRRKTLAQRRNAKRA